MANTKSAQKAIRQSKTKRSFNTFWKGKVKSVAKTLKKTLEVQKPDTAAVSKELTTLQKVLDKAAKTKAIHKNKANRLKSRYAKKVSAQLKTKAGKSNS